MEHYFEESSGSGDRSEDYECIKYNEPSKELEEEIDYDCGNADIYREINFPNYTVTEDDKLLILQSVEKEFGIKHLRRDNTNPCHKKIFYDWYDTRFTKDYYQNDCFVGWIGLWGSVPPFANIRAICAQFLVNPKSVNDPVFKNSETDKLCRMLHNKYVNEYIKKEYGYGR